MQQTHLVAGKAAYNHITRCITEILCLICNMRITTSTIEKEIHHTRQAVNVIAILRNRLNTEYRITITIRIVDIIRIMKLYNFSI